MHEVNIYEGTILKNIIGLENGIVTSTHHQSVDRVGEGLAVNAKSSDGIVEGIEYLNKSSNHFLLGIQWHPEKFSDFNNPFSKNILYKFVEETLKS
jgi:putative glutamine amidotransferase